MEQGLKARAIIAAMAQSLSFVLVHVVFSTKDRASLLDGEVCGQLHADLATVARNLDCECYRVGGMADHLGMPGQTVVGYADLLNVLDRLLAEFGGQDGAAPCHFHAGKWLGQWLREPHPALGGVPPATYMQAPSGRTAVTRILGGAFSGAYQ
ncbi:MAG: DUF2384 domain-containing protein [Rhodanobacteraceae bacterium]|nr:DUF2384 domain-containing protein [Rhodanobacteraceae bacterium]